MSGRGRHSLPDHMVCGQATQHYVWFIVFCRVAVVSTRRGMLVFPMVYMVCIYTRLAFQYWTAYSDSHQPRNTKKGTPR